MLNALALPSSHRTGGFPASGVPRYLCRRLAPGVDVHLVRDQEAQVGQNPIRGAPRRKAEGTLAPTTQMTDHATAHVVTDLLKHVIRITQREVIHPALQVSVDLADEPVDGLQTLAAGGHFRQYRLLPVQRFRRRTPVQITPNATKTVADVPKLVAQKVQMRSFFV